MIKLLFPAALCFCLFPMWTLARHSEGDRYSNIWVAKIEGGEDVAQRVARDKQFTYKGMLRGFDDYYELLREDHPAASDQHSEHLTRSLKEAKEVKWAEQQKLVRLGH